MLLIVLSAHLIFFKQAIIFLFENLKIHLQWSPSIAALVGGLRSQIVLIHSVMAAPILGSSFALPWRKGPITEWNVLD